MLFGSGRSQFAKLFLDGLLTYFMSVLMDWVVPYYLHVNDVAQCVPIFMMPNEAWSDDGVDW